MPGGLAESGAGGRRQSWAVLSLCSPGPGANLSEGLTSTTPLGLREAGTLNPHLDSCRRKAGRGHTPGPSGQVSDPEFTHRGCFLSSYPIL